MRNHMRLSALRLAVLLPIVATMMSEPVSAQTPAPMSFCYVPLTGTVYRIKTTDTRQACSSTAHIEFTVTDGSGAIRTTTPAGGDVTGMFANLTVSSLMGRALAANPPQSGQVLTWDGTHWVPASPATSGSGAPSGTAGGDLGGTYPNPSVTRIQGQPVVGGSPATGQTLTWNGSAWAPATPAAPGVLGGDPSRTYTVVAAGWLGVGAPNLGPTYGNPVLQPINSGEYRLTFDGYVLPTFGGTHSYVVKATPVESTIRSVGVQVSPDLTGLILRFHDHNGQRAGISFLMVEVARIQ